MGREGGLITPSLPPKNTLSSLYLGFALIVDGGLPADDQGGRARLLLLVFTLEIDVDLSYGRNIIFRYRNSTAKYGQHFMENNAKKCERQTFLCEYALYRAELLTNYIRTDGHSGA